ncbi:NUDIX hydrolase [Paenibacillus tianjinensis]|uniref:NUDIX domain-containing protein n=1 Tax=Paenibacillus tianjinensis TaxID=2810347 RepID=A0ABX7LFZ5_9BACL|nr:NUDIX domain-containing protein [Paenibacillus tianjinensis]QSF46987.1 NUDIX domain-containing protein [Paenibacillus tianjinensis]
MKVTMYETGIDEAVLKYVVIVARQGEQWIMAKHRERSTWEFAGGHIEPNESPDEAAARELYEETGAEEYTLYPISIYSVVSEGVPESFGKLYLAAVHKFGQLPQYEMGEIKSFAEIPEEVTYPMIYPALMAKVKDFMRQHEQI